MTITLEVAGFQPLTVPVAIPAQSPAVQLWRVPHDVERINVQEGNFRYGGDGYRKGTIRRNVISYGKPLPEVYRCYPSQVVSLRDPFMWLWRNINQEFTGEQFCKWLGNELFLTNRTGFPGRRNVILQKDLTAKKPAFDETRLCGGAVVEGVEQDGKVYIRCIVTSQPTPTSAAVLADEHLWYWGTSVNPQGEVNLMTKMGKDGQRHPGRMPIIVELPIWLPANELHKLPLGAAIPDPRWMA